MSKGWTQKSVPGPNRYHESLTSFEELNTACARMRVRVCVPACGHVQPMCLACAREVHDQEYLRASCVAPHHVLLDAISLQLSVLACTGLIGFCGHYVQRRNVQTERKHCKKSIDLDLTSAANEGADINAICQCSSLAAQIICLSF